MEKKVRARILIVDNDPRIGIDLREILEPKGFAVAVAEGKGDGLIEQAKRSASQFQPHVVIIDLRLYLDELESDGSGLMLLQHFRSARCILYSAYLKIDTTLDASRNGAFAWVSKGESPQKLIDEVEEAVRKTSASQKNVVIRLPPNWSQSRILDTLGLKKDGRESSTLVDDLLCQLFPNNTRIDAENIRGDVVTPQEVSRGRSIVLKVFPDDLEPVVVKFGPSQRIGNERVNYEKYVKNRLAGSFYAQLIDAKEFWELGGTVYSFLGSSLRNLPSFTDFYRNTDEPEAILRPLRHFFDRVWSRYYRDATPTSADSLFQIYDSALELESRLESIKPQEKTRSFSGLSVTLTDPVNWVMKHKNDSRTRDVRETVTHGDLHGDNLFVDGEHAWAIDFERTGESHILRDFVELETDIVTRLAFPTYDCAQFYPFAIALVSAYEARTAIPLVSEVHSDKAILKTVHVVNGLRRLAHNATKYMDIREYYWALLFNTLFVAALMSDGSLQRDRALLLASIICGRLRHWGQKWPPKDWPQVQWINRV